MIITCPSCSARYPVDATSFAPSGRKVRCAKCGNTWHQAPPSDLGADGEAEGDTVAASLATRAMAQNQKPMFNSGAAKPKVAEPVPVVEAPNPVASDDPFDDDDDIMFAPAVPSAPAAKDAVLETPVRLYETPGSKSETGSTLRRYLSDVASMRRGRVFGAIGWVALVLFVAGSIYGVVQYRREIAAFWPSTIKLYEAAGAPINLVGFELAQVSYERQDENGLPVLAIKGEVVNISGETKRVPRLRVGLRDDKQHELYHWTFALAEGELKPDAKASFTTRLSSPPAGARDLEVRFVEPNEEPAAPLADVSKAAAPVVAAPTDVLKDAPAATSAAHKE